MTIFKLKPHRSLSNSDTSFRQGLWDRFGRRLILCRVCITFPCILVLGLTEKSSCSPAMVFLLSGQSNMTGVGLLSDLPSGAWTNPGNVRLISACDGGNNVNSENPQIGCISGRFGPELGISEQLGAAYPNRKIVLVKLSYSGASLQKLQYTNLGWFLGDGVYKNWLLPKLSEAFSFLSDRSKYPDGYQISGILWMQGESDAIETTTAQYGNYSTALKSFVESELRVDLAKRSGKGFYIRAPFVYSQISSIWPFYSAIHREQRRAQAMIPKSSCITAGKFAQRYLHLGVVPGCDPCEPNHYDWVGQLELGRAFGRAMVNMLNGITPEGCANTYSPFLTSGP